jgi:hypothetical protein
MRGVKMTQRLHDQWQWAVAFGVSVAWLAVYMVYMPSYACRLQHSGLRV